MRISAVQIFYENLIQLKPKFLENSVGSTFTVEVIKQVGKAAATQELSEKWEAIFGTEDITRVQKESLWIGLTEILSPTVLFSRSIQTLFF